ncbi:hypothetical protein PTSG_02203 [Salpingoeca rosetta]|uniref:Uncharacterized protein n=1 Tax=Salpingoeca rosetta (strain ATCC 50818 / BSB-021) TaxID=946362 RepID=F2U1I4_SALR5|nr:uncharacterized protein PTSG_02203 [Salpingoeca rosetta]EGD81486.1 hypothetical protein PTSG_02203 [Salpingoeca rosetta]|eukprot:XP_004996690.1 hypothetical protein PTSG_02203 [Salpingoeca rosetta]
MAKQKMPRCGPLSSLLLLDTTAPVVVMLLLLVPLMSLGLSSTLCSASGSEHGDSPPVLQTVVTALEQVTADISLLETRVQEENRHCLWWPIDAAQAIIRIRCLFPKQEAKSRIRLVLLSDNWRLIPWMWDVELGSLRCRYFQRKQRPSLVMANVRNELHDEEQTLISCSLDSIQSVGPIALNITAIFPSYPKSVPEWQSSLSIVIQEDLYSL